jgi:hypothetical protein
MPKQNRVTPFGEIVAIPERGTFMGNRGVLHDPDQRVRRAWQVKRWLICVLEFRGRRRTVMTPNSYTELFFLDEATALAAGHRPCAECRNARFLEYCKAWQLAHPLLKRGGERPKVLEIDNRLHAERIATDRTKRTYIARLDDLPDGVFVAMGPQSPHAYVIWRGKLYEWSPAGYKHHRPLRRHERLHVLTPPSTVSAIRAGYAPDVHASVGDR